MVDYNILDRDGVLRGAMYKEDDRWTVDVDATVKEFDFKVDAEAYVKDKQYRIVPTPMVGYTG